MAKRKPSYDQKCADLAGYFLADAHLDAYRRKAAVEVLSQLIQDVVDGYFTATELTKEHRG